MAAHMASHEPWLNPRPDHITTLAGVDARTWKIGWTKVIIQRIYLNQWNNKNKSRIGSNKSSLLWD